MSNNMYTVTESKVWTFIAGKRIFKKILAPFLPEIGSCSLGFGFKIYLDLKDWTGPSYFLLSGGAQNFDHYEEKEKWQVLDWLPEEGVFVDVGANVGFYSLFVKKHRPKVSVHAFEPHPLLFQCLKLTANAHPRFGFEVREIGIGREARKASLYFHTKNSGGHSFLLSSAGGESHEGEVHPSREVWIQSLDQVVIEANWPRLDFVKIDVQDLEAEVIEGAQKVIERFHPSFLIECNHDRLLNDEE